MAISPEVTWPGLANSCPAQPSCPTKRVHSVYLMLAFLFNKWQRTNDKMTVIGKGKLHFCWWLGRHPTLSWGQDSQNAVGTGDTQFYHTGRIIKIRRMNSLIQCSSWRCQRTFKKIDDFTVELLYLLKTPWWIFQLSRFNRTLDGLMPFQKLTLPSPQQTDGHCYENKDGPKNY